MRNQNEINEFVRELKFLNVGYLKSNEVEAMIDVLENNLEYDDIEDKYYDGNESNVELMAIMALDYKEGNVEREEILAYYN